MVSHGFGSQISEEKKKWSESYSKTTRGSDRKWQLSMLEFIIRQNWISEKKLKVYLYKLQMNQEKREACKVSWIWFAKYCQGEQWKYLDFLKRVVFSDECKLFLCGFVNKQNCLVRVWDAQMKLIKLQTTVLRWWPV